MLRYRLQYGMYLHDEMYPNFLFCRYGMTTSAIEYTWSYQAITIALSNNMFRYLYDSGYENAMRRVRNMHRPYDNLSEWRRMSYRPIQKNLISKAGSATSHLLLRRTSMNRY